LAVSLAGIGALTLLCLQNKSVRSMPGVLFLAAGAIGNLTDRLLYRHIVDWIYVGVYVNLADLWLFVGSALVAAQCVKTKKKEHL
jgi:lipoprotein signal peptidase